MLTIENEQSTDEEKRLEVSMKKNKKKKIETISCKMSRE